MTHLDITILYRTDLASWYHFVCSSCGWETTALAEPRTIDLLLAAGCPSVQYE